MKTESKKTVFAFLGWFLDIKNLLSRMSTGVYNMFFILLWRVLPNYCVTCCVGKNIPRFLDHTPEFIERIFTAGDSEGRKSTESWRGQKCR